MAKNYDWALDAKLSYLAAIAEIRKRGIIEGRFKPIDNEKRSETWRHVDVG